MPEPPDFDQIARGIVDEVDSHVRESFIPIADDPVREMVIRKIAAQLLELWNARGAADLATLDTRSPEPPLTTAKEMVTYTLQQARRDWWREGYAAATHALDRALRTLDR